MLRRALAESMKQLKMANSDAGAMVDRRIVTKLLITYFERGRSDQSVLNLMASMLGFTGEGPAPWPCFLALSMPCQAVGFACCMCLSLLLSISHFLSSGTRYC
jgi:hypothetical protein